MKRKTIYLFLLLTTGFLQNCTEPIQKENTGGDLEWSKESPAGIRELQFNSEGSLLQGFMYKANENKPHPLLILLHGYPGNDRNLDIAQSVRAHGWNVIYFNYRGSWGSQGEFSFRHCVEDVKNVVAYCKKNAAALEIDTAKMVLFGHSMGGFVCLKALQEIPEIKKGFALSAWDIYSEVVDSIATNALSSLEKEADNNFVLNKKSGKELFAPIPHEGAYYDLALGAGALSNKQVVMLDEHRKNEAIAKAIQQSNHSYFSYDVWLDTDHSFTNKRASLTKKLIDFLNR